MASANEARIMKITTPATNSSPLGDTVWTALAARGERWTSSITNLCRAPRRRDQALQLDPAQPQRIGDHADRAQRHRRRSDDGRQQDAESRVKDAGGDRYAGGIVAEREEQVLPDVAHRRLRQAPGAHYSDEVALEQGDARALDRDVGAGAHGDADFGSRQRRRVVHA